MSRAHGFSKHFLTGLVIIFPAFITISILQLLFGWVYQILIGPVAELVAWIVPGVEPSFLVQGIIMVFFVLGIAFIGFGTRVLLLRRIFGLGEALVRRTPIVGKIYGTMREIADTFAGDRKSLFGRVVLLEWPRAGMYAIGFVTSEGQGEVQEKTPEHVVNVFIPTTPNPTSGYLVLAPRESLISMNMSVEEGMRLVISGGASGPAVKVPKGPGGGN